MKRLKLFGISLILLFLATSLVESIAFAGNAPKSKSTRQKVIDFDGDLVEGMNKRPWDSLSQVSDKDSRRRSHLYQKRKGFRTETQEALQELRFLK